MPRLRPRFVVKLGIVIICMMLLGPIFFHLKLNDRTSANDAEDYKKWQEKEILKRRTVGVHEGLSEKHFVKQSHKSPNELDRHPVEVKKETAELKDGIRGNFEPPEPELKDLPGENGKAVVLSAKEMSIGRHSVSEFGFNMVASDKVAMDRVIPDTRPPECPFWHYPEDLPTASVILVFHNEGFSTLVRTIHSVINTSPSQLLKEVVLVDDYSSKAHLKNDLEEYIKQFQGLVKLYRNDKREGLIRTRTRGAQLSIGDAIVFLDAHCECNKNWLVPLLDRIRLNRKAMAVPIVDRIDWNTMEYSSVYGTTHNRGIFEWGFFYKETLVPDKELLKRKHDSEPYWSPTHAGGLFAMDRKYFNELGGYDPQMKIWGGENYELSFKIWQCGGIIEWVPCSHVGHIYRNHMPYDMGNDVDPQMSPVHINYMRVVEVWMDDEFKNYFYIREPSFKGYDFGNITAQLKFKKEHNCKSFKWFMDNIAYDVYEKYPRPPPNKAWGEIRLRGTSSCWDSGTMDPGSAPVRVHHCYGTGTQKFRLNIKGQLGLGERCILSEGADTLHVSWCPTSPVGPWEWDQESGVMKHRDLKKCVEVGEDNRLHLKFCSTTSSSWDINEVYRWKRT